jgi:hypothetical protein
METPPPQQQAQDDILGEFGAALKIVREADAPAFAWAWADDVSVSLEVTDFVEGVLTEKSLAVLYGQSNTGKSFIALDIAAAVAGGKLWFGKEVDQGAVLYVAAEGGVGVRNRIAAMKKEGRIAPGAKLAVITTGLNILDPRDTDRLIRTIADIVAKSPFPIRLIILDTLSRVMPGANENDPGDMTAVVCASDGIREATGACVLFVHHSGKNQAAGSRGHSSLRAATDAEIEVTREEGERVGKIVCRKAKDLEAFAPLEYHLKTVELGTNRRGKPVTSCVVGEGSGVDNSQGPTVIMERVLEHIKLMGPTTIADLRRSMGCKAQVTDWALKKLAESGRLKINTSGRSKTCSINEAVEATFDPKAKKQDDDVGF